MRSDRLPPESQAAPSHGRQNPFRGALPVLRKEAIHIRRDPMALFVTVLIPLLQMFMIGFAIDTGHYYAYSSFSTTTTGPGAYFFARAIGNLDGDAQFSTFERVGTRLAGGELQSSALMITNELE